MAVANSTFVKLLPFIVFIGTATKTAEYQASNRHKHSGRWIALRRTYALV
jgi:hypothetical protein